MQALNDLKAESESFAKSCRPLETGITHAVQAAFLLRPCCLQVVVGVGDPNPLVASEGIATLETAGIEVRYSSGKGEGGLHGVEGEGWKVGMKLW